MVTKPNLPVPPAPTGLEKGRKMDAPQLATSAPQSPKYVADPATTGVDPANKDRSGDNKFKLPDKVSQKDIYDNSFKYGGGRSAGNRSLADNMARKMTEQ